MVPNEADALKNLMVQVVNVGTGSALKRDSYQVAGKTGSAEFDKGKETHAWFVGFAPADDPKIAVCVIVEEGGSGGHTAAPIAAKLFDAWLQESAFWKCACKIQDVVCRTEKVLYVEKITLQFSHALV